MASMNEIRNSQAFQDIGRALMGNLADNYMYESNEAYASQQSYVGKYHSNGAQQQDKAVEI